MHASHSPVAVITGGSRGIGAATAQLLAERGFRVVSTDVSPPTDAASGSNIEHLALDVTDPAAWTALVDTVMDRHGRVDVLVNAAGIQGDLTRSTLENATLDQWRAVLSVNLDGTFLGCQAVMPVMKAGGGGSIVNVSSLGAYYPTTYNVAYGASKGAVRQLTKTVAEVGSRGPAKVRCNSVHPGIIHTEMIDEIRAGLTGQRASDPTAPATSHGDRIPLERPGTPQEAAAVIAFLASTDSSYVTGSEFVVDGGSHLNR